jgi:methylase of polypeptide subunit release factors
MSLLKLAHQHIQNVLQAGDTAIDATVGNGHDTQFLAEQVGLAGRIYGFDIQTTALNAARAKLQHSQLADCVTLIQVSHADMANHIPINEHGKIKACMFNLGYLPKGDKTIITQTGSTLSALTVASDLLAHLGIMTILAYSGHAGGDEETASVKSWLAQLSDQQFAFEIFFSAIPSPSAPRLFVVKKIL